MMQYSIKNQYCYFDLPLLATRLTQLRHPYYGHTRDNSTKFSTEEI
jgi:hypothetical protein